MIKSTNKISKRFSRTLLTVVCFIAVMMLSACGSKPAENTVFSVDDLSGKKIGVQLGTTGDIYCSDYEEDGSGTQIERFNKGADAVQALKQGKIDAVVIDSQPANSFISINNDLMILDEEFVTEQYAICVSKSNPELTSSLNSTIADLKADGTIDKIISNYIGEDASKTPYTPADVERNNGTLTIATNAYFEPYEYYSDGKVVGIDIDLSQAIADKLGMNLKVEDMEFDSIITAVQSGKANMGVCGMTVTEERLKNIDFTDSYTTSQQVIIVRNNDATALSSNGFVERFKTDFLKDGRYLYILNGLRNTLIIALCAALMGIVIGFLIAVVRSSHDKTGNFKVLNFLCNIYLTVIRGTPTMVQLLIIYYIIFGSLNVNKIIVAILAFGINSGAYVAEIFRSGIMSIDNGQFEAARSLGLPYRETMISVILPQAFKNVLPALANEFIVLLKETSISGYIGLTDLTRGGDIIRSITYDAMLPLLGVALVYLVLVVILSSLVKKLERRLRSNERH